MKAVFLFLFVYFIFQNFSYSYSKIEELKHKDFKEWEKVFELVSENKLEQAIKENEEIIEDFDEDSHEKISYGQILGFEFEYNLKNFEKAFKALEKINYKNSLSHRFFRLMAYKRFYDSNHYIISQNNEAYISTNISTWRLEHFHRLFKLEALNIGNHLLTQKEFAKSLRPWLVESNYPHDINTSIVEIITYGIIDLLSDQRIWAIDEEISLEKELESLIEKKSNDTRKLIKLTKLDSMAIMIYKLFINLENSLWKDDNLSAMLNSRLELVKFLKQRINSKKLKISLTKKYEIFLRDLSIDPWWSSSMDLLSRLKLELNDYKVNQDILSVLNRCIEIFPESHGAKKCKNTLADLKRPRVLIEGRDFFNFNSSDLVFETKNIEKLYIKVIPIDELKIRSKMKNPQGQIRKKDVLGIITDKGTDAKEIEIKDYQEYRTCHNKFPLKNIPIGTYLIAISSEKDFSENMGYLSYKIIQNTPLNPVVTYFRDQITIRLLKTTNSKKQKISKVNFLSFNNGEWKEEAAKVKVGVNDITVQNKKIKKNDFLLLESGKDKLLIPSSKLVRYNRKLPTKNRNVFISQQKIYRPEDQVKFKIISRALKKGVYVENANAKIHLNIKDVNNSLLLDKHFDLNEMGSVIGSFLLPKNSIKGKAKVFLQNKLVDTISIEEYKKPNYKIESNLKNIQKNKDLNFRVQVSDYQNRIINNLPLKLSIKRISYSYGSNPFFVMGSFPQNKKEKIIYEKVHHVQGGEDIILKKDLFLDGQNFAEYEFRFSGNYNGESLSYVKQLFYSSSKNMPSLELIEKPFNGNLKFKLSNLNSLNEIDNSNKGKLLIYKLKNEDKPLEEMPLDSLYKFFDIGKEQKELIIKSIPHGAYRAIYEVGEGRNKVEAKISFVTYHSGKFFPLRFKVDQSKKVLHIGEELKIFAGTNLTNKHIYVEIMKNGKTVKEFNGTESHLYTFNIPKDWFGHYSIKAFLVIKNDVKLYESDILVKKDKDWEKIKPILPKKLFSGETLKVKLDYPKNYEKKRIKVFSFAYDARLEQLLKHKIKIPEFYLKENNGILKSNFSRNFNTVHFWDFKNIKIPYLKYTHLNFLNLSSAGGPGLQKGGAMMLEAASMAKIGDVNLQVVKKELPKAIEFGFFEEKDILLNKKHKINFKLPEVDMKWKVHIFLMDKHKNIQHFERNLSVIDKISLIHNNPKIFSNDDNAELSFELKNNFNINKEFKVILKNRDGKKLNSNTIKLSKDSSQIINFKTDLKKIGLGKQNLTLEIFENTKVIKKETILIDVFARDDFQTSKIITLKENEKIKIDDLNKTFSIRYMKRDFDSKFKVLIHDLIQKNDTNSISLARKISVLEKIIEFINNETDLKKVFENDQEVIKNDMFGNETYVKVPKITDLVKLHNELKSKLEEYKNVDGGFCWHKGGESNFFTTLRVFRFFNNVDRLSIKYIKNELGKEKNKCVRKGTCFYRAIDLLYFASKVDDFEFKDVWDNILKLKDLTSLQKLELSLLPIESIEDDVEEFGEEILENGKIDNVSGLHWNEEKFKWKYYEDTFEGHLTLLSSLERFKISNEKTVALKQWLVQQFYGKHNFSSFELYKIKDHFELFKKYSKSKNKTKIKIDDSEYELTDKYLIMDKKASQLTNLSSSIQTYEVKGMKPIEGKKGLLEVNIEKPVEELVLGDSIELKVSLDTKTPVHFTIISIPIVAGLSYEHKFSGYDRVNGKKFYRQIFKDKVLYHFEELPTGKMSIPIKLKAQLKGKFFSRRVQAQIIGQGFTSNSKGYDILIK